MAVYVLMPINSLEKQVSVLSISRHVVIIVVNVPCH